MLPLNWVVKPPLWTNEEMQLLKKHELKSIPDSTLETIIENSEKLPRKFPIDNNRCKTLKHHVSEEFLMRNANSAYPLVHENILHLYAKYIVHKCKNGNNIEKEVYKSMDLCEFVQRLLTKRAATFIGRNDRYTLPEQSSIKGSNVWESIGTNNEKAPLLLKDYLSYEEIKLSAFLSVSSYTYFINKGERKNFGIYIEQREQIEDEGVIVGIIGPRLIKDLVMDYQEMIITEQQNSKVNGYGKDAPINIHHLFADLYEEPCLLYTEMKNLLKDQQRYTKLTKTGENLDNFAYYKRLVFTMDLLFMEANQRAFERQKQAYIHVVGIGLGVWKKTKIQNKLFLDTCADRIKVLGSKLHNVSDICFAWMDHDTCGGYKHGDLIPIEGHPLQGITVYLCNREPHERLPNPGKLLVVSYAWDGNAWPGNEFWLNKLGSSGDSAAASSTQIAELHNAFINPKVCSANLKVVTKDKVVELYEYIHSISNTIRETP